VHGRDGAVEQIDRNSAGRNTCTDWDGKVQGGHLAVLTGRRIGWRTRMAGRLGFSERVATKDRYTKDPVARAKWDLSIHTNCNECCTVGRPRKR
jgi:hypothetical protein